MDTSLHAKIERLSARTSTGEIVVLVKTTSFVVDESGDEPISYNRRSSVHTEGGEPCEVVEEGVYRTTDTRKLLRVV
jgi:hypothetical protein